jgi:hypothetical protein
VEDDAVEDMLVVDGGTDAVDSGPKGETLQYVKKPRILNQNTPLSYIAACKSKVSFESGK